MIWPSLADKDTRDTGVNAIESLMAKKGKFDYILLETTGLADPGNLAPLFWMDDGLGSTIYLDGIVTLVDAKNILRNLDDATGRAEGHEESDSHGPIMTTAHVQISHADVVVINKADLVNDEELRRVTARIESINGLAKIHVTKQSVIPRLEGFLLDLHAYDNVDELDRSEKGHSHLDPVSRRVVGLDVIICWLTLAEYLHHVNTAGHTGRQPGAKDGCLVEVGALGQQAPGRLGRACRAFRSPPAQGAYSHAEWEGEGGPGRS